MSAAGRFIGFARPMTISISRNYFWEIFFEDEPTKRRYDPNDEFDILWQFPSQFGKGHSRLKRFVALPPCDKYPIPKTAVEQLFSFDNDVLDFKKLGYTYDTTPTVGK